jgi:hypothetical protein
MKLLLLSAALTVLALLVAKRPTITTVVDRCEPVSCEPCDADRCAALANLECEWAKGPSVALQYCQVVR